MVVDKSKNTQKLVTLPDKLIDEIDDYWYKHRFKNRSEAIRALIRKGLDADKRESNED